MNSIDLSGKVAIITGGSRGLGKAMATGLAKAGASVVVASRKLENCEAVCEQIKADGGDALSVATHTGDTESIDNLLAMTRAHYGRIDIVINNAAINPGVGPLSELSPSLFQKMFAVDLMGPWYLASRAAADMAKVGGGNVINVISVAALKPPAYQGFYAALKAGLNALTKVMAAEWAADNIRVNSLALGSYHSDLFDNSAAVIPGLEQGAIDACLQKRIADTKEILGPVMYLLSDMSRYTTGSTLLSDGGYCVL
ncbi:MAG: NAD(P)-dependent dehydrogenase (short-subunit alcohol dehydrogenase family) [Bermanella sp.]|jgi:NAD(P)-dependent dehydrogenase (short-subunit alcohol dehydrogenase family)